MSSGRLSLRALNRATLARQLLLGRAALTAGEAVRHLAGLQAQAPLAPYVGLWTRLAGFRQQQLKDLLTERAVVRAHLMRNTVHLVDARDYVRFRPLYQPLLDRDLAGNLGRNLAGVDLAELAAVAAAQLGETPLTRTELGARLAWSGLTRLREVTDRLGSRLRAFTGPDGARLLDLPDAPRPDPGVPAPPRFLPEYDNLLLSYAERSRVIPHRRPVPLPPGHGATGGTLLTGGWWQAGWTISQGVLEIRPFTPLSPADRDAVAAEGERLLGFAAPATAIRDVRFAPVRSG